MSIFKENLQICSDEICKTNAEQGRSRGENERSNPTEENYGKIDQIACLDDRELSKKTQENKTERERDVFEFNWNE